MTTLAINLQPTCNQLATDCISRQELLNAIFQKEYGHDYDENTDILNLKYVDIIKMMPSVEPERKPGEWLKRTDKTKKLYGWYQCSQCGAIIGEPVNYCSECGSYNGGSE